jgi:hypothetical protein
MKELLKKFENLWVSIAFAEAGEHEISKQLLEQEVSDEGSVEIRQTA